MWMRAVRWVWWWVQGAMLSDLLSDAGEQRGAVQHTATDNNLFRGCQENEVDACTSQVVHGCFPHRVVVLKLLQTCTIFNNSAQAHTHTHTHTHVHAHTPYTSARALR